LALLQLLLLTELFRKLLGLPTLLDVVVLGVVHRALLDALIIVGRLMWVLVLASVGGNPHQLLQLQWWEHWPAACPCSRPSWAVASALGLLTFPTSRAGCECQERPSTAMVHLSAMLRSSKTSCTSRVANF
jgi:hypothetical protein